MKAEMGARYIREGLPNSRVGFAVVGLTDDEVHAQELVAMDGGVSHGNIHRRPRDEFERNYVRAAAVATFVPTQEGIRSVHP